MYKQLFLVAALCIAVYAANQDDDDVRAMKTELEQMERDMGNWHEDVERDTQEKVEHKVRQARKRGSKSENCAKTAGCKFKEDVKSTLHGEPRDVHQLLKFTLRKLEEGKMSKSELEKLKKSGIPDLKKQFESAITTAGAKIESLGIEYALTANKC